MLLPSFGVNRGRGHPIKRIGGPGTEIIFVYSDVCSDRLTLGGQGGWMVRGGAVEWRGEGARRRACSNTYMYRAVESA